MQQHEQKSQKHYRAKEARCREQTYGHQGGKAAGHGGGMNWEIGIDMYSLICIK